MSSTNKTSHYNLSQYASSDKPTYLVDYNTDMSNIDTGIYNAKNEADTNATNIGTLSSLTTTAKTSLVSAINEVDGNADTANSNIGTLSSLTTTVKTDVVSAINEVDANADTANTNIGTLSNLSTTAKTNLVASNNELYSMIGSLIPTTFETVDTDDISVTIGSVGSSDLHVAKSSDATVCKIYGNISINTSGTSGTLSTSFPTSLRPSSAITIKDVAFNRRLNGAGAYVPQLGDITIATNGTVTLTNVTITVAPYDYTSIQFFLIPVVIFLKDFGDTPE